MSIFKKVFAVLAAWSQEKTMANEQEYRAKQEREQELARERAASQQEAARVRLEQQMEEERRQNEVPKKDGGTGEVAA